MEKEKSGNAARLPRRPYGSKGIELSIVGVGGISISEMEQERSNRIVSEAVEKGVNYFDVAPTYGNAEQRMGPALKPYRKNVFLACKTTERKREGAQAELIQSLERLQTDYLDLYQLHAIKDVEKDVDVAFGPGGAMEVFIEAKKSGQVRHLGFSAHSEAAALAAMERYDFDSALFPVNFATMLKNNFGYEVISKAREKGVSILALKSLARQEWPRGDNRRSEYPKCWYQPVTEKEEAKLAMAYTLAQPVTALVPPGDPGLCQWAIDLGLELEPLTKEGKEQLAALSSGLNPLFPRV
jgi:aryl-alcohol dehydrogenase-like predicted oxidoreductase